MCQSGRIYQCNGCNKQVIICSHCDHGNEYCSKQCSKVARLNKQREASCRYQSTRQGKIAHAARQKAYRLRQIVTHQGSLSPSNTGLMKKDSLTRNDLPSPKLSNDLAGIYCHFCHQYCGEFLRFEPIRRRKK